MKLLKCLLLLIIPVLMAVPSFAQMTPDPTTWSYEVKKKSATEYQLIFHVELQDGWHLWSLKPGGDGFQIIPSFAFARNPKLKLKGSVMEKGNATTKEMDGVDGKVSYLSGKIDYIQNVIVTGKITITGKHEYQVCNDNMCLAPKERDFTFEIK